VTDSARETMHEPMDAARATMHEDAIRSVGVSVAPTRVIPAALLEEYEFDHELLARGAQADLVVMRIRESQQRVAVKLYRPGMPGLDEDVATRLQHADAAHVVRLIAFETTPPMYEVQEYFDLGTLADLAARCRLTPPEITSVLEELSSALAHVHGLGIAHRDLKPANVFVRSEAPLDLVLGDFGLSREVDVSGALGSIAGSLAYMAPEVLGRERGRAGDWWALGLIIFELLTGHHLYQEPGTTRLLSDAQIHHALYERRVPLAEITDPRWLLLLRGLLTPEREHRWGEKEVRGWLTGGSPGVHEQPRVGPTAKVLVFAGERYSDPVDVATAFGKEWEAGASGLSGSFATDLTEWLHSTPIGRDADDIIERARKGKVDPHRVLVELQMMLAPGTTPAFRGRELAGPALELAATRAQGGDESAAAWIRAVRTGGILSAVAKHVDDGASLSRAEESLRTWWMVVAERLAALQTDSELKPYLVETSSSAEGALLTAALSPQASSMLLTAGTTAASATIEGRALSGAADSLQVAARSGRSPADAALAVLLLTGLATRRHQEAEAARVQERQRQSEEDRRRRADEVHARATRWRNAWRNAWRTWRARLAWGAVPFGLLGAILVLTKALTVVDGLVTYGPWLVAGTGVAAIVDVVLAIPWSPTHSNTSSPPRFVWVMRAGALYAAILSLAPLLDSLPSLNGSTYAVLSLLTSPGLLFAPMAAAVGYLIGGVVGLLFRALRGSATAPVFHYRSIWLALPVLALMLAAMLRIPYVQQGTAEIVMAMPSWARDMAAFRIGSLNPVTGTGRTIVAGVGLLSAAAVALAAELRTVRWRFWVLAPLNICALASLTIGLSYGTVLLFGLGAVALGILGTVLVGLIVVMALAS
jgi:serine/threonine protein kinase